MHRQGDRRVLTLTCQGGLGLTAMPVRKKDPQAVRSYQLTVPASGEGIWSAGQKTGNGRYISFHSIVAYFKQFPATIQSLLVGE